MGDLHVLPWVRDCYVLFTSLQGPIFAIHHRSCGKKSVFGTSSQSLQVGLFIDRVYIYIYIERERERFFFNKLLIVTPYLGKISLLTILLSKWVEPPNFCCVPFLPGRFCKSYKPVSHTYRMNTWCYTYNLGDLRKYSIYFHICIDPIKYTVSQQKQS